MGMAGEKERLTLEQIPAAEMKILSESGGLENVLGKDEESIRKLSSIMKTNIVIMKQELQQFFV